MKKIEIEIVKKIEIEIKLEINFYDSFFFGGGTGSGKIQSYLLRDVNGYPYISGSALKGCIAEYAAALSNLVPGSSNQERIFGTGGVKQGCMYFENGTLKNKSDYFGLQDSFTELRTGVSISSYTKAKKEGHLFTMETSGQSGSMTFESSIYGFLEKETYQDDVACLVAASRLIFALGGRRSAGLGWLETPIKCSVFQGERPFEEKQLGEETSKRKSIESKDINQWIENWIGGKRCTK